MWAYEKKVKAVEAALARREPLLTTRETPVVVLDDHDDVSPDPQTVKARRSSQATAHFEAGFEGIGVALKEVAANPEEQKKSACSTPEI